jgi:hypothetical protein
MPATAGTVRFAAVRKTPGAYSAVFVMLGEYLPGEVQFSKHHGRRPVFGRERISLGDVNGH